MAPSLVRRALGCAATSAAALLAVSCGGTAGSSVSGGTGSGNGTGSPTQPDLGNGTGAGGPGGSMPISRNDACVQSSAAADAVPAVVQMVVDTSGSMEWGADGDKNPPHGESKWAITSAA